MNAWAALESTLDPTPEFYVQMPPKIREGSELSRQRTFLNTMRMAAPRVMVEANANAGKRNPRTAKAEGIKAGVFDLSIRFKAPLHAWIEFKGFDKRGRPGQLSANQIEWGNRLVAQGWPVACFFDPFDAVDWLREQGFPIGRVAR